MSNFMDRWVKPVIFPLFCTWYQSVVSNKDAPSYDIASNEEEISEQEIIFNSSENSTGFHSEAMFSQSLIKKIKAKNLKLKASEVFDIPNFISRGLGRQNHIYWYVSTEEISIDVRDSKGTVYLPLLTKQELNSKLKKIPSEISKTISTVHLGAIRILLKAQFREGIDSPITMLLIDDRINDRKDALLGAAKANLACQKFLFTVYPKFGLSIRSANLDKTLSFYHRFERSNLMKEGDKLFSISYLVSYALTNSHHSIEYREKPLIEIDDVFSEVGQVENGRTTFVQPDEKPWTMDVAQNKQRYGTTGKFFINEGSSSKTTPVTRNSSLKEISEKIDNLGIELKRLS